MFSTANLAENKEVALEYSVLDKRERYVSNIHARTKRFSDGVWLSVIKESLATGGDYRNQLEPQTLFRLGHYDGEANYSDAVECTTPMVFRFRNRDDHDLGWIGKYKTMYGNHDPMLQLFTFNGTDVYRT